MNDRIQSHDRALRKTLLVLTIASLFCGCDRGNESRVAPQEEGLGHCPDALPYPINLPSSNARCTLDENGNIVATETDINADGLEDIVFRYTYDERNLIVRSDTVLYPHGIPDGAGGLQSPMGTDSQAARTYEYDDQGRLLIEVFGSLSCVYTQPCPAPFRNCPRPVCDEDPQEP